MEVAAQDAQIPPWERRWVTRLTRLFWIRSTRGRPRDVPAWLPHERLALTAPDGARLSARWFKTPQAQASIVLAHPHRRYAQDWFVLTGWIDFLRSLGLNVMTFDFVGYGESHGGSTYLHDHVSFIVHETRRRAPEMPLHLLGVSLGAFAAANASKDVPVDTLILESPYPTFASWYRLGPTRLFLQLMQLLFPRTGQRIDARQSLRSSRAQRILIVASGNDRVTPAALSRALAESAPPPRTQFLELNGPDHLDLFQQSPQYRDHVQQLLTTPASTGSLGPHTDPHPQTHALVRGLPRRTRARLQPRAAARPHHGPNRL